jgi:SSS family solute:Na+ symporter
MGLGSLLWAFYDLQPNLLPSALKETPDAIFPYFIGHQIPQGLTGLILTGLIAATMSTLSSDLNSLSAVLLDDYYIKIRRGISEKQRLNFSRISVLIAGILAVIFAMMMTQIKSMVDAASNFVSLVAGGILGMYLLGLLDRKCSPKGIYIGLIIGVTFIIWTYFGNQPGSDWYALPVNTLWIGLFGNIIVLVVGYVSSRILSKDYLYKDP